MDYQGEDKPGEHEHDSIAGGVLKNIWPASFAAMGGIATKSHTADKSQKYEHASSYFTALRRVYRVVFVVCRSRPI
jgi:hypothetical protein